MAEAEGPAEGRWVIVFKHSLKLHTRVLRVHVSHACAGAVLNGNPLQSAGVYVAVPALATEVRGGEIKGERERKSLRGTKFLDICVLVDRGEGFCSLLPACTHVGFCIRTERGA